MTSPLNFNYYYYHFFGLMPSWDSCSWWFISYTAFRLLSTHIPKTQAECPCWVPLLAAPFPPCFSFLGSLILSCDWLSAYLFPHLHWLWRPGTMSWSVLNSRVESCVSNRVGMQYVFIQQMKYWMLILPDCINIVCIFKITALLR